MAAGFCPVSFSGSDLRQDPRAGGDTIQAGDRSWRRARPWRMPIMPPAPVTGWSAAPAWCRCAA